MEKLKEALEDKCKVCRKAAKKNKLIAKQWKVATEDDIEIVYMPRLQKVSKFSCRVDRYYKMRVEGKEFKNSPVEIDNISIGYPIKLYNVVSDDITEMMKDLFQYKFYNRSKNETKDVFVTYNGHWDTLQFLDLQKEMMPLFEKKYQRENETKLFNSPEYMTRITFTDIAFTQCEDLEYGTMAAIFLRIKDKKGKPLKMYIGKYIYEDNSLQDFTTLNIEFPWIYDEQGNEVKIK
ncbi:MAG: hypothetical protein IJ308_08135 [Clostridia bacterium]|nr:hypothetical protein [Clostridia bacterium]MBQ7913686.1 hypothetical protein [Clostridia bacterium]